MTKSTPDQSSSTPSSLTDTPVGEPDTTTPASKVSAKTGSTPPIIGVGTSAGGLEALELFFAPIPAINGAAFVVIQHLDPTHQGILPELLQRVTPMTVTEAGDGMQVKPNWVYVIPSNKDLSILHGKLHLLDPVTPRGLRLPIDGFFRALADDQHERAIGVILSGMGSDGTLGMRAIKENAGLTLVQSPDSAQFDSMPRSAIDAGLADIIESAQEMWGRIYTYLKHSPRGLLAAPEKKLEEKSQSALEQIIILLRERTGNDFSLYKKNTIFRRVERRMGLHQINAIAHYARYLRENPQELDFLFKELLIGVTNFFRDPEVWEFLKTNTIPELLANPSTNKDLRAWVPACSTGEEAYSLAIVFKEAFAQTQSKRQMSLQIFATDLDQDAIDKARQGYYPANIAVDVSEDRLSRFFSIDGNGYRVNKEIREMVTFAPQNVIMDPPFTKLNVLCCRNLLIYLNAELQKKLIPLFHYALTENGILLLGNSETISGFGDLYEVIDNKSRLYRRIECFRRNLDVDFPTKYSTGASQAPGGYKPPVIDNLQTLADQFLLQHFSPAAVLVNTDGDILYINGRTGKYLEPAAGKANWNIHAMARDGLRHVLSGVLRKAQHQAEAIHMQDLTVGTNGGTQTINLAVQAIRKPVALNGMLFVVFSDAAPLPAKKRSRQSTSEQKSLEIDLQHANEDIQTLREEMQSSQEELRSANEELQSTNEELQSSNEELTTSKEEMQSLNEELQTVNAELQAKVDDLSRVSNDMNNLLNSMDIATVFLDSALNIRRFTKHIGRIFKLISSDVGRPLSDIVTDLDYPQLQEDAHEVLRTLVFAEKQVEAAGNRWFKVRIMPYRTQDNIIDGVVITFIDISETKQLEAKLRALNDQSESATR